jgi:hypothetical protein
MGWKSIRIILLATLKSVVTAVRPQHRKKTTCRRYPLLFQI